MFLIAGSHQGKNAARAGLVSVRLSLLAENVLRAADLLLHTASENAWCDIHYDHSFRPVASPLAWTSVGGLTVALSSRTCLAAMLLPCYYLVAQRCLYPFGSWLMRSAWRVTDKPGGIVEIYTFGTARLSVRGDGRWRYPV